MQLHLYVRQAACSCTMMCLLVASLPTLALTRRCRWQSALDIITMHRAAEVDCLNRATHRRPEEVHNVSYPQPPTGPLVVTGAGCPRLPLDWSKEDIGSLQAGHRSWFTCQHAMPNTFKHVCALCTGPRASET